MSTSVDIKVDISKFDPSTIPDEVHAANQNLMDIMSKGPAWYEVGAQKYREMRARGETPLPAATLLDSAEDIEIPSREEGRMIPCRVLRPQKGEVRGVYMHIHGGGWVLQSEKAQDPLLQLLANNTSLIAVSIGYRLAPEHPFPAAPEDCFDAAEYLVSNAGSVFGADLMFIAGESAGGHLSMLSVLHLLNHPDRRFNEFRFRGVCLHYGAFDLSCSPSVYLLRKPKPLVLDQTIMEHYLDAFLPGMGIKERHDPSVSPLYADLEKLRGRLPPTLFTVGTEDCLLDDTVFMSTKWQMAGGETKVLIVPGAPHAYTLFPRNMKGLQSAVGVEAEEEFMISKMA